MKVLVEVDDNKGEFVMELLNSFSFAKAKAISPAKAQLLEEIKEAVENLNLVKEGKIKLRPAEGYWMKYNVLTINLFER